jgi:dTDP-4-amino-4,6-dideoxygalactose transaminase
MAGYISFTNTKQQYSNLKPELDEAIHEVLSSGQWLSGNKTKLLEDSLASRTNRKFAIALNSGTTALESVAQFANSLRYIDYKHAESLVRKETVTTNLSYIITKNIADYIFPWTTMDVDANGLMLVDEIDYSNTDTIITVNLFGQVVDYEKILFNSTIFNKDRIRVIEDAAQSFGSNLNGVPSGKLGWASVFSFDPTKVLNCSSGGMVLTDDADLADHAYGYRSTQLNTHHKNYNRKITEIDSAMLLVKLNYVSAWQKRRTEIANYYIENIKNVETLTTPKNVVSNWSRYPIVLHTNAVRNLLQYSLDYKGIEYKIHYNYSLNGKFPPGVSRFTDRSISLPLYAELSDSEVETIVQSVNSVTQS